MLSKKTLLQHLPKFNNNEYLITDEQTIGDIKKNILRVHEKYARHYDNIYNFFIGKTYYETCKNIFDFVKQNVSYCIEPGEAQILRSPAAILNAPKGVDCKCYALFCNGVLDAWRRNENRDFDVYFRFAGYNNNNIEHVFSLFKSSTGKNIFWIDPVLPTFDNRNKKPTVIQDKKIDMALYEVNGINQKNQNKNFDYNVATMEYDYPLLTGLSNPLPMVAGGFLNVGQDANHLKTFTTILQNAPAAFLYLFIYPKGNPIHSQWDRKKIYWLDPTTYNSLPTNVIQKQKNANAAFFDVNGETDNVINTGDLLTLVETTFKQASGMTPVEFWARFFGLASLGDINFSSAAGAGLDAAAMSLGIPPDVLNSILSALSPFHINPSLDTFKFDIADWKGTQYPIDKTLFVGSTIVNPNTGNNGSSNNGSSNNQPTKSNLLPLVAAGIAAKLLFFS